MKFWKRFINILRDISNQNRYICELLDEEHYIANEEPIKEIKNESTLIAEENVVRRNLIIQNIGLEPCYIKLGGDASVDDFHCVLASDTSPKQGNGGSIELKNWHGEVYAICNISTKLSILEY